MCSWKKTDKIGGLGGIIAQFAPLIHQRGSVASMCKLYIHGYNFTREGIIPNECHANKQLIPLEIGVVPEWILHSWEVASIQFYVSSFLTKL